MPRPQLLKVLQVSVEPSEAPRHAQRDWQCCQMWEMPTRALEKGYY